MGVGGGQSQSLPEVQGQVGDNFSLLSEAYARAILCAM